MKQRTTRLGVLVPSANVVTEPDMYRMAPAGVSSHFARVKITEDTPEQLEAMAEDVPKCCEELSHGNVDVLGFACTGGSLIGGVGYDARLIEQMEELTEKPATTTATAVLEALRELSVERVSIATPYEEWLNEREASFLEEQGIEVVSIEGLGIRDPEGICAQTPDDVYELATRVDRREADAVFVSCTDLRAAEALDRIEESLGKPAVSSNQATIWQMLRLAGVRERIDGFGELLRRL